MSINKDNYEEYFLLYADNELSAVEKNNVEDFVKQYPELEEELLMIKLSVSKPDDECILEDKSFLFKEADKFISGDNYQEVFVLYNDNELTGDERRKTEEFLEKNPVLKNDFELLQKVKLEADHTIVFPDKKLLYKREDNGKIIPLKWWKVAAAAILLGIGIWSGVVYLQNDSNKLPAKVENNTVKKTNKIIPVQTDTATTEQANVVAKNKETKAHKRNLIPKGSTIKPSIKKTDLPDNMPVVKNQSQQNALPTDNIITKDIENEQVKVLTQTGINPIRDNIDIDNSDNKISNGNERANVNKDSAPKAVTTSFAFDENENNNNYAFYNIPQEKFNKSKLGGFLRKVKRIIERKISPLNNSKDKTEVAVN